MACLAAQLPAFAGTIVPDIDDADPSNVFTSLVPTTTGANSYAPTLANGVTLAAQLTPNQADVSAPATTAVAVIETGGTTSGSGIWMLGGNYWFLTSNGNANALPSDTDGSDSGIGVNLGPAVADQVNNVWASFDGANAVLKAGVNGAVASYPLSNVDGTWNWTGNDTVSLGQASPVVTGANLGHRGGLVDNLTPPAMFDTNAAVDLSGTVSLGQVFNTVSNVPEPSSLTLLGLVAAGLLRRRR
ncbi:MAG: PEP-CTERM sorting domain-containing protein [Planctomycetales bacterium]|nr:PEP-CTERM sorting domain-containing protein [Planctomycetales bacterium]